MRDARAKGFHASRPACRQAGAASQISLPFHTTIYLWYNSSWIFGIIALPPTHSASFTSPWSRVLRFSCTFILGMDSGSRTSWGGHSRKELFFRKETSMSQNTTNSGFTWTGLLVILTIFFGALWLLGTIGRAETPRALPSPPSIVRYDPIPATTCETCHHVSCSCRVPRRPKPPTFFGEVDGFKTSGEVRCHGSHEISMGGSRVSATGIESSMNAQLLHSQALASRERSFGTAVCATRAMSTPPKEVVKTVVKPVYVPVPTFTHVYIDATTVCDVYGRRWKWAGYDWR